MYPCLSRYSTGDRIVSELINRQDAVYNQLFLATSDVWKDKSRTIVYFEAIVKNEGLVVLCLSGCGAHGYSLGIQQGVYGAAFTNIRIPHKSNRGAQF